MVLVYPSRLTRVKKDGLSFKVKKVNEGRLHFPGQTFITYRLPPLFEASLKAAHDQFLKEGPRIVGY